MQRIVPNIWFDHTAAEAAEFYTSIFPSGRITATQHYPTEGLLDFQSEFAGQALMVEFELAGYQFMGINAGSEFTPNPAISFMVNFSAADPESRERLDALWASLIEGGVALMPLQEYPFSPHYGWVQDRYGVSWQLMLSGPGATAAPAIVPSLMFGHTNQGRAAEAIETYTALFGGSTLTSMAYPPETGDQSGQVMFADFTLFGQVFAAMDSAGHTFTFNPGVSLMVSCDGQAEIDRLWDALSAVPEAEACGWCADRFGVSWQLIPDNLGELMSKPDAYPKLMAMKKIDIAAFG